MTQPVILHLESVTKQFPRAATAAVCDLSLTLHQGELLGLLGPSGCGKTTLLRLIAGFEHADTGTIALAGQPVAASTHWLPPEKRDVGMVFQDYALFPHLTVAENVAFGLRHRRRLDAQKIRHLAAEAIALVGLTPLAQRYPHELSGGQQQRVALARALAPQPALVLLDEPLSNLDVQVRLRLRQEIRDILKRTGTSAVLVTHDQEEALSIADRVAVMRQGHLEQFGTPEALYREPASRFVAEFVTQANFLPARWTGRWETEVGCFEGGLDEQTHQLNLASRTVDLMIRQEDLIVKPDDDGTVLIRDRQFLGREHRYCLTASSGRELYARSTARDPFPLGARVSLAVTPSALQVFPSEGQAARGDE